MHAPLDNRGPQAGFAFVLDRRALTSRERLPALALADITTQINLINAERREAGDAPLPRPATIAALLPVFANANPHIDTLLSGGPALPGHIGCSSNAQAIGEIRSQHSANATRIAASYGARVPA
jgi:hypothetical protein